MEMPLQVVQDAKVASVQVHFVKIARIFCAQIAQWLINICIVSMVTVLTSCRMARRLYYRIEAQHANVFRLFFKFNFNF